MESLYFTVLSVLLVYSYGRSRRITLNGSYCVDDFALKGMGQCFCKGATKKRSAACAVSCDTSCFPVAVGRLSTAVTGESSLPMGASIETILTSVRSPKAIICQGRGRKRRS